jgi:hypothetical protein
MYVINNNVPQLRRFYLRATQMHLAMEDPGVKMSQRRMRSIDGWLVVDWAVILLFLAYYVLHVVNIAFAANAVNTLWETDQFRFVDVGKL